MSKVDDKKITVSVGIAAYNAEQNIYRIVAALLNQREGNWSLSKIIVHSDASTDNTVKILKAIKSNKVTMIDNKKRTGFAGAIKTLMNSTPDDIVILLNDDILIRDRDLVSKLIKPFINEDNIGLVCGNPLPLKPKTFVEKAVVSSIRAYQKMSSTLNEGNNVYYCDGKIMVLNRSFVKKYKFPIDLKEMGNVDWYTYFLCIKEGFKFRFVKQAKVYFRSPYTIGDFIKLFTRNNAMMESMHKKFGQLFEREQKKPTLLFWRCLLAEFLKNPLGCLFIFTLSFYITSKSKKYSKNFNPTWNVVTTSKNL